MYIIIVMKRTQLITPVKDVKEINLQALEVGEMVKVIKIFTEL